AIFDLAVSADGRRPDAAAGESAARAASSDPVPEGRVGAGAGATAGAYLGFDRAVRTGIGSCAATLQTAEGTATIGVLAVANPAGDLFDAASGRLLAGHGLPAAEVASLLTGCRPQHNTTLVAVATDAVISKGDAAALSVSAHAGLARAVRPSHTPFDGVTCFVMSTGLGPAVPPGALAVLVHDLVAKALARSASAGAVRAVPLV